MPGAAFLAFVGAGDAHHAHNAFALAVGADVGERTLVHQAECVHTYVYIAVVAAQKGKLVAAVGIGGAGLREEGQCVAGGGQVAHLGVHGREQAASALGGLQAVQEVVPRGVVLSDGALSQHRGGIFGTFLYQGMEGGGAGLDEGGRYIVFAYHPAPGFCHLDGVPHVVALAEHPGHKALFEVVTVEKTVQTQTGQLRTDLLQTEALLVSVELAAGKELGEEVQVGGVLLLVVGVVQIGEPVGEGMAE